MGKPSAPAPTNPTQTAAAQTSTNVSTAIANSMLNNVNQYTPTGSLRYDQTGSYGWTDPTSGSTYNIPTFTATQILSPQEQQIQAQQEAAKYNLSGLANTASGNLAQLMSNNIDLSGAPAAGDPNALKGAGNAQTTIDTSGLANASNIQSSYGDPSQFQGQANQLQQSIMQRMQPQLQQQQDRLRQQLADQGINYGSQAYTAAMDNYNRMYNDAQLGAVSTADTEQQQLQQMAAAQGAFANQAQAQAYNQAASQAAFANQGVAQNFQQAQGILNAQNTARQQYLSEQYAQRDQPINEISALMSGSQVSAPGFVSTPQQQIPTTDIAGITNQAYQQQFANYQQQSQNWNSLMGGLFGMAGGLLKASDERIKDDVVPMGSIWANTEAGGKSELPIYEYSYKQDPDDRRHVGPMAQDVQKIQPKAVKQMHGVKYLDMRKMGSVLGVNHG